MIQTFSYPPHTRRLWLGGLALPPLLYAGWLLTTDVTSSFTLCFAAWPGLGLAGLWLYALILLSQKVMLTEAGLRVEQLHKRLTVPYNEIYYGRRHPAWLTGLTLVTTRGEIHLGKHLQKFDELHTHLESRYPNLTTPHRPLPWRVPGNRATFVLNIFFGGLFALGGIFVVLVGVVNRQYWLLLIAPLAGVIAGLFVYGLLTQPRDFILTPTQLVRRTLLNRQSYQVAKIRAIYRDSYTVKTKNGQRTIHRSVLHFRDGHILKISQDDLDYPFDEFHSILVYHYAPPSKNGLPWPKEAAEIHFKAFAQGSLNDFRWYFEKKSQVPVTSIEEICDWLQACQYIHDEHQFQKRDHWLHPTEFEQLRRGDCEDHALWAWRKLVELGYEAEFIVGDMNGDYHAWVIFEKDGQAFILETVNKGRDMVSPVERVKALYRPDYGVDGYFVTYRYRTQASAAAQPHVTDELRTPGEG